MERIAIVGFLWVFGALLFFLNTGALPQTRSGWVLFLVFAPPLYFVFELLGEVLFGSLGALPGVRTLNARVKTATAGQTFSWLRVAYGLIAALVLIAAVILVVSAIDRAVGPQLEPLKGFLRSHFDAI